MRIRFFISSMRSWAGRVGHQAGGIFRWLRMAPRVNTRSIDLRRSWEIPEDQQHAWIGNVLQVNHCQRAAGGATLRRRPASLEVILVDETLETCGVAEALIYARETAARRLPAAIVVEQVGGGEARVTRQALQIPQVVEVVRKACREHPCAPGEKPPGRP